MRAKQIAVVAFSLWLILISFFMLFSGRFDAALFFVLGFIGFLVVVMLTDLRYVRPDHARYIRVLIIAGIILSGAIVILKAMEILGLYFTWSY